MTYGNGMHFNGSVNIPDMGWHFYNVLDVYHNSGPGIKKSHYSKSHSALLSVYLLFVDLIVH
jgi:hypothetical protein